MRKFAWAFTLVSCGQSWAQWQELHPYIDYWGTSQPSQGGTTMIGPGVGVHVLNLYYSPSTGSGYQFYRTESDWEGESTFLFDSGYGQGRSASGMVCAGDDRIYYQHSNQGIYEVHWISDVTGQASEGQNWSYYSGPVTLGAVNDTLCFAAYTRPDGPLFVIRVENGGGTVCDTIAQDSWYPRHLDFIDAQVGAMVIVRPSAYSKVLTTQDGGLTWLQALVDSTDLTRCVEWSDDSTLWVAGDGGLLRRSRDRGDSWEIVSLPYAGRLTAMDSYSSDSLWIGGSDGMVMVTGNSGVNWEWRPVNDMTVTRLQLFDGVAYVHTKDPDEPSTEFLHKWRTTGSDMTRIGTGSWWSFCTEGIQFSPAVNESLTGVGLYDMTGREVEVRLNGLVLEMRSLPAGLYVVRYASDQRQESGKVLWLSKDN